MEISDMESKYKSHGKLKDDLNTNYKFPSQNVLLVFAPQINKL